MFTGIVQTTARVERIERLAGLNRHTIVLAPEWREGLTLGASVAHNGCCLTVAHMDGDHVTFELMRETLARTNLGTLQEGDAVNIERSARMGDEIGGHVMSGHIAETAAIVAIETAPNNCRIWFALSERTAPYVLPQGFIGIDGASLTVADVEADRFSVNLIPETLARTTLGQRQEGERVNIELDAQTQAIVATVERVLAARQST